MRRVSSDEPKLLVALERQVDAPWHQTVINVIGGGNRSKDYDSCSGAPAGVSLNHMDAARSSLFPLDQL